jgi:chorismate synthase
VIGEAMVAVVLAEALLDKFGHDNMTDIRASHDAYRQRLRDAIRSPEGAKGRS